MTWWYTPSAGRHVLLAHGPVTDREYLEVRDGNFYKLQNNLSYTGASVNYSINTWYHVAVTRNDGNMKMYHDGGNVSVGRQIDGSWSIGNFGRFSDTDDDWHQMIGLIDDVQIYGRALEPDEVKKIYDAGSDGICECSALDVSAAPPVLALGKAAEFTVVCDDDGSPLQFNINYGDDSPAKEAVSSPVTYTYMHPGVYNIMIASTKEPSVTAEVLVVVFDPEGGSVKGKGWVDLDEDAKGKAEFEFAAKYEMGAAVSYLKPGSIASAGRHLKTFLSFVLFLLPNRYQLEILSLSSKLEI